MFHKALWLRNYKQGKVAIWLLWVISLYSLPCKYMNEANFMDQNLKVYPDSYFYSFDYGIPLLLFGGLSILLACILIGGERSNQGMDAIFAMPFKRRDIFLSKWLIGAVNITAITLVNMLLMFIVQKTTIHGEYQTFAPFLHFFLLMFIALLAVYSVALFIGTITGEFVSQVLLTVIACVLPNGLFALVVNAIGWHIDRFGLFSELYWKISDFFTDISLYSVIHPSFWYDYQNKLVNGGILNYNPPSLTMYIGSLIYLVIFFPLGLYLFERTPSENNGKIIVYKKLEPVFLWSAVICFSSLGGRLGGSLLWDAPLVGYYIGVFVLGFICYKILSKLMKKPLKFGKV